MLRLNLIPGLGQECRDYEWKYKWRNKSADMDATRQYHEDNPPKVGDTVVVLRTWGGDMCKPHVTQIKAITDRGRLVVDHDHEGYAGKSFYKSGQNCYAPTGQCWLVPGELYRDIPLTTDTHWQRLSERVEKQLESEQLSVSEMAERLGGMKRFVKEINDLIEECSLNKEDALAHLSKELIDEKMYLGKRAGTGMRITREMLRNHSRNRLVS